MSITHVIQQQGPHEEGNYSKKGAVSHALLQTPDRFAHLWLIKELEQSSHASSTDHPYETKAAKVITIACARTLETAKHDDPREGHAGYDIYRHPPARVSQQHLIWLPHHHVRIGKVARKIDYLAKYECATKNVCDKKCVHNKIDPVHHREIAARVTNDECGFN